MKDIAWTPEYDGILIIITAKFVILSITMAMVLQKIELSGPYSAPINNIVSAGLFLGIFLGVIIFVVKWAVKSYIVKYACDSGGFFWDFKIAASVTGYAYIADIIMGIIGICVAWVIVPPFHIDTTNIEAARHSVNDYQAQVTWLCLVYTSPLELLRLVWKSYLGGLGAHFGTKENCSLVMGVALFFLLGLISLLISLISLLI
jgi:hypothetical protein